MATLISFSPSVDLHLLRGQPGIPVKITAVELLPTPVDVTAAVLATLTQTNPGIFQIAGTSFDPVAVGESLCVLLRPDVPMSHYLLVRVRVHNLIQDLWLGNNVITLRTSEHLTLSVYAKFDDNSVGDISKHPYLTFSSDTQAAVTVDASGLITAVAAGSSILHVTEPGGKTAQVSVTVLDPVTENPIVERVWGSGPINDRWNLLILGEGFTAADKPLFDRWALEVAKRLFEGKSHSPYNLLRNSWNVWKAFESTSEKGITVGQYLSAPNAQGFSVDYDFDHPDANGPRILQNKDSRYGLMYGARLADRLSMQRTTPPAAKDWYQPWKPFREIGQDARRTSMVRGDYFSSLKNKNAAPGSPEYDIGKRWIPIIGWIASSPNGATQSGKTVTITTDFPHGLNTGAQVRIRNIGEAGYNGVQTITSVPSTTTFTYDLSTTGLPASGGGSIAGPDSGLVAFLVYDDRDGGTQFGDAFAVSLGNFAMFRTVSGPGLHLDHNPDPRDVFLDAVGATFAHEMAHALQLGDEYEGDDDAGHTTIPATDRSIEIWGNLTDFSSIRSGTNIDPTSIKWDWDRMVQSSRLMQDVNITAGSPVVLTLKQSEGSMWNKALAEGTEVYLRRRVSEQTPSNAKSLRQGPLKVTKINGDTVIVQGAVAVTEFKAGSVLYVPRKDQFGRIMTLIPDLVSIFIQRHGAFPRSDSNCSHVTHGDKDPPEIPGFHLPRHHHDLVGLYIGGGTWNCDVYRPCGICKMREDSAWESYWTWWPPGHDWKFKIFDFCFVCKYSLVDLIDAGQHALLDREYPEDC